jgi:hypothetical protein
MKYRTKIGVEFDDVKVVIEEETESTFHSWKTLAVLFVFLTLIIGVVYAKVTGDTDIFDKMVDAVVIVTTEHLAKENGKEK